MKFASFFLLLWVCFELSGQNTFNARIPIGESCLLTGVEEVNDGYLLLGINVSNYMVAKIDLEGELQWTQFYNNNGSPYSQFSKTFQKRTGNDGFVDIVFSYDEFGQHQRQFVWIDLDGNITLSEPAFSDFYTLHPDSIDDDYDWYRSNLLTQDEEGNLYESGFWHNRHRIVRKSDPQGNELWTYIHTYSEDVLALTIDELKYSDGKLFFHQSAFYNPEFESHIKRLDVNNGNLLINYPIDHKYAVQDLEFASDMDFIVGTARIAPEGGGGQACVARIAPSGETVWEIGHGEPTSSVSKFVEEIIPLGNGEFVAGGEFRDNNPDNPELNGIRDEYAMLFKFNESGETEWLRLYKHVTSVNDNHRMTDLKGTSDGGFIFCGDAIDSDEDGPNFEPPVQQAWVVKVDAFGCIEPGCQFTNVEEIALDLDGALNLSPNPSNGIVKVDFNLPETISLPATTEIRVYSLTGELIHSEAVNGQSSQVLNLPNISAGKYIVHWMSSHTLYDSASLIILSE